MFRLSTNMKLRNYIFIPPMGRLDSDILESIVKITDNKNLISDITVSEYLQNSRGIAHGMAADGLYYSEVLSDDPNTDIFRSLATKYIPAGASYTTEQPTIYVTADSDQSSFRFVAFEDNTKNMSEEAIQQAINANNQGYTVKGKLKYISSLLAIKIITLQDNSELIWKTPYSLGFVRMETPNGINISKPLNTGKDFLFWELVDRNVPDSDIVDLLTNHLNINDRLIELESKIQTVVENTVKVANSIETLLYQLDYTKTTVNFLATKISEQKAQISSLQSSVSSYGTTMLDTIQHVDIEQGSNFIKLEDMSKNIQGLNFSLAQLTVLPSKIDNALNKDTDIIVALDDIKLILKSQDDASVDQNPPKDVSKVVTILSLASLVLQVFNITGKRGAKSE